MKLQSVFAAVVVLTWSISSYAAEADGVVKMLGSDINQTVTLIKDPKVPGTELCKGDVSRRIGRLAGMTVKVQGDETVLKGKAKTKCFEPTDFAVMKTSSGEREPLVGKLLEQGKDKDGQTIYAVEVEEGKAAKVLTAVPPGLRKMVGKKVIVDIKPMEKLAGDEVMSKVVSYAEFP